MYVLLYSALIIYGQLHRNHFTTVYLYSSYIATYAYTYAAIRRTYIMYFTFVVHLPAC